MLALLGALCLGRRAGVMQEVLTSGDAYGNRTLRRALRLAQLQRRRGAEDKASGRGGVQGEKGPRRKRQT